MTSEFPLVASKTFVTEDGVWYYQGLTRVSSGDDIALDHPDLFKPIEFRAHREWPPRRPRPTNPGTTVVNASVTLSGIASLTATPSQILAGASVSLAGVATLSATATVLTNAAVSLSGVATLSATASVAGAGPVFSNITADPGANSVTISWNVSPASTGQVAYGTTPAYGSFSTLATQQLSFHSQVISGLASNTTYFYKIMATAPVAGSTTSAVIAPANPAWTLAASVPWEDTIVAFIGA